MENVYAVSLLRQSQRPVYTKDQQKHHSSLRTVLLRWYNILVCI